MVEDKDDVNVTDEDFVEGMVVAMEEWLPGMSELSDSDKQDMVQFVKKNKDQRNSARQ